MNKQTGAGAKPKGAGGIIYAELGNVPKNRPMAPPILITEQSVIYSDIKASTDPNKVSNVIYINVTIVTILFIVTSRGSL